jgi:uncharacterized protein YdhG (YjbR/CyaY superfamily)
VSQQEIDRYLAELDEPKRTTLGQLRDSIAGVLPEAEQCISYGASAFRIQGKVIAGFAAFKNHLSYLPHSGSVLSELKAELSAFAQTRGALHFPIDEPLPRELVQQLIAVRLRQAFGASSPAAYRA